MKESISKKVNKLGEEIAVDVNNIENKIKLIKSDQNQFGDIIKQAMFTLESKFDRAMEHKPITNVIKQNVDYGQI